MNKRKRTFQSMHLVLLYRVSIALFLLVLTRVFIYLFNYKIFSVHTPLNDLPLLIWQGLRFDLAALAMVNAAYIFFSTLPFSFRNRRYYRWTVSALFFYIPNALAIGANLADVIYFRFTLKRTSGDVFNFAMNDGFFINLLPDFLRDFWYMFLLWGGLCWLLVFLALRRPFFNKLIYHSQLSFFTFNFPMFAIWMGLLVLGIRGGLQLKPLSPIMAASITSPERLPLVINTPFSIIKTIKNQPLSVPTYFSQAKALHLFNPDQKTPNDSINGSLKGYNVVVLILESFSLEHTTLNGNTKGFTPFLDSLAHQGVFAKGIANGKRSIEAIPAILSSLPTWMNYDFITSPYSGNKINSLPSLLKPQGYTSIFLHGGNNGTMSFDSYASLAGFDKYIGRKEYNNDRDFDGTWGIWDEPFLQFTSNLLSQTKQPFVAALFTLSSHHPYKVPIEYMYKLPKGSLPIQQSIAYADQSLRRFFKSASKQPWYNKTLFVLVADHTSEGATAIGRTKAGQYSIPIIFFAPGQQLAPFVKSAVQQTDIMPGILHLLGYHEPFTAFGESPFVKGSNAPAISYNSGVFNLFRNDSLAEFNGKSVSELYNLTNDALQSRNLSSKKATDINISEKGRAIIQLYYEKMKNNKLTPQQ